MKTTVTTPQRLGFAEFVTMMALISALVALSIDMMLPALPEIGRDLGVTEANNNQLIISFLFFGLATGQLIFGSISDSTGRKPAILVGAGLFIAGCLLSVFATTFPLMLTGRVLQGIGVASPRTVSMALIRDQHEGREMARVMSFVMTIFILVPAIAPSIGQGILLFAHWRAIFVVYVVLTAVLMLWFSLRQPETLPPPQRVPFSLGHIGRTIGQIMQNRLAFGYTVTAGFVSGAFVGYLNSAQQIFQDLFQVGEAFALYFGLLALAIGAASFVNGALVQRLGMRRLVNSALIGTTVLSFLFWLFLLGASGRPPFWLFLVYMGVLFFGVGILFGNLNAMAMQPLGKVAGIGAAVVGSFSILISTVLGTWISLSYNQTLFPLVIGFALLGVVSILLVYWIEKAREVDS